MTTDTDTDTFKHGIGISTLASERGAVDDIHENSPVAIHGVLIPENTVLRGGQKQPHFYTPSMAERAADVLSQQVSDPDHRFNPLHLVKNFHELEGQAPADDIIGEVTAVGYSPGVGVVFEAETTDMETANKIKNNYLQVSPSTARVLGSFDETMEARAVSEFVGARDVAIVGRGQPGVEVNVGPNPAIDALAFDALSRVFDTDTLTVSEPDFDGYSTAEWDAPTLEDTFNGDMDAARNSATWIDGEGDTFEDLSLFVLDGDGELNTNALDSAWRLAPQTDGPTADDVARLRGLYEDLAESANEAGAIGDEEFDNVWADRIADTDTNAPSGDDGVDSQSTDGPADGQADDQSQTDTMSNDLTDDEKALLAAVDDPSEAIDVLRDYSSREEPRIIDASNYETIEPDALDTLRENVRQAKEAFAALLAEDSPLSVDALARSDMDALTEPFRDDDGAIDIDTLRQTPETGDVGAGDGTEPSDNGDAPVDIDTLSLGERDDLKRQVRKRQSMLNRDMDKRAGEIETEIVDTLGADSFDDVAADLEAL